MSPSFRQDQHHRRTMSRCRTNRKQSKAMVIDNCTMSVFMSLLAFSQLIKRFLRVEAYIIHLFDVVVTFLGSSFMVKLSIKDASWTISLLSCSLVARAPWV